MGELSIVVVGGGSGLGARTVELAVLAGAAMADGPRTTSVTGETVIVSGGHLCA